MKCYAFLLLILVSSNLYSQTHDIGAGLTNLTNLEIIIENAGVPVIIDAGIGTPSEATKAMELGADGVLLNTAVAQSKNPEKMAYAMNLAVKSGRIAYLAGRMEKKYYADPSSPLSQISKIKNY